MIIIGILLPKFVGKRINFFFRKKRIFIKKEERDSTLTDCTELDTIITVIGCEILTLNLKVDHGTTQWTALGSVDCGKRI